VKVTTKIKSFPVVRIFYHTGRINVDFVLMGLGSIKKPGHCPGDILMILMRLLWRI